MKVSKKPRILIVEDEDIARENLRYILSKEDYEIDVAGGAGGHGAT